MKDIINFLTSYWFIVLAIGIFIGWFVYKFIKTPIKTQLAKAKEWLLWAVAEAEKELGSGTGQLKLRYVYNMFIEKFPFVSKMISFKYFSTMVDEVLNKFKTLLEQNEKLQNYIRKDDSNV